jgi:hypothetical protein
VTKVFDKLSITFKFTNNNITKRRLVLEPS